MTMSFWDLVQKYVDETGATEASIMRRARLNKGTFTAWRARGVPSLPSRGQMLRLADAMRVDYETVLMAVLHDTKYLPEDAARAEQERIYAAELAIEEAYAARVREHVRALLEDTRGDVEEARELNDELRADGSIEPELAGEADGILRQYETEPSLAARFDLDIGRIARAATARADSRTRETPENPEAEETGGAAQIT